MLSSAEKAVLFLLSLEEDIAAPIVSELSIGDLRKLREVAATMREVSATALADAYKEFLDRTPERVNTLTLTFAQIEVVIEDELPPGASEHRAGWANDPGLARARGWLPDWRTGPVSVEEGWVTFTRVVPGGDAEVKGEAPTSSYDPLRVFLENVLPSAAEMMLGFEQIEILVGFDLPPSARKYQEWWANPGTARGHPPRRRKSP